jgi:hypothetical protein
MQSYNPPARKRLSSEERRRRQREAERRDNEREAKQAERQRKAEAKAADERERSRLRGKESDHYLRELTRVATHLATSESEKTLRDAPNQGILRGHRNISADYQGPGDRAQLPRNQAEALKERSHYVSFLEPFIPEAKRILAARGIFDPNAPQPKAKAKAKAKAKGQPAPQSVNSSSSSSSSSTNPGKALVRRLLAPASP